MKCQPIFWGKYFKMSSDDFCLACYALIFIHRHTIVARYYGFTLDVHVSVHLFFLFPDDNLSTVFTLSIQTPQLLTIYVLKFEPVQFTT